MYNGSFRVPAFKTRENVGFNRVLSGKTYSSALELDATPARKMTVTHGYSNNVVQHSVIRDASYKMQ